MKITRCNSSEHVLYVLTVFSGNRWALVSRDRDFKILPPFREGKPRILLVHTNDHDTGASLWLRVLEPPTIVFDIDMSRDDGLFVSYDPL